MRVAIAGKGGAGKTTLSASLARLAGRSGTPVVAIDADSNPNLMAALGVDRDRAAAASALAPSIVSRRFGGPALSEPLESVLDRFAVSGPDGVRVALMGMPAHADQGCLCGAHATVSAVLDDLGSHPELLTIVDLEASPEHLSRGTARHVDALLLVTEPYYRSLETVRRLASLASELPIPRVAVVQQGPVTGRFRGRDGVLRPPRHRVRGRHPLERRGRTGRSRRRPGHPPCRRRRGCHRGAGREPAGA
ncbi:MAG: AAA family ATPase [Actinomycetota bacterium]|nr:AAA family ATPase [Actinomycetota bacterium]